MFRWTVICSITRIQREWIPALCLTVFYVTRLFLQQFVDFLNSFFLLCISVISIICHTKTVSHPVTVHHIETYVLWYKHLAVSLGGYFWLVVISFRLLSSWWRSSWKRRHLLGLPVKIRDRLTPAAHSLVTQGISCERATAHMNVRETARIWLRNPVCV